MSRKFLTFWFIILPDFCLMFLSLYLTIVVRYHSQIESINWNVYLKAFSFLYLLWLLIFFIHGLFELFSLRRYTIVVFNLVSAMAVNLLVSVSYFYIQPNLTLTPKRFLLINVSIAFLLILLWHLLIKYLLKNRFNQNIYLFSFNKELMELEKEILGQSYLGYKILGHLNEQSLNEEVFTKDASIVLPENITTKPEVLNKFYELRKIGVGFYNHKTFYENLLRKVYLSQINELWFLENVNYKEKKFYNLLKRVVDLICGLISFIIFLISYPIISLVIKIESSGPAVFTQERVGKNGSVFKIYKYRTMTTIKGNTWTEVNDPRITKVGNFLRKSRLDELPQSINLIKGNISLVGPRPEQVGIVEKLRKEIPFFEERHWVKPGLTGWAQLNIYAGSIEESRLKLQYDLYYIKHRSLLFDLEIILKTIYYIFTWRGR
jgi:exopolysaccharide biosynthesis polyprenyl glycosylphosphotransferase